MNFIVDKSPIIIKTIEEKLKKNNLPNIEIGDSINIGFLIQEGNKERVQISEGVVISKNNANLNTTITVRKILQNVGVDKNCQYRNYKKIKS